MVGRRFGAGWVVLSLASFAAAQGPPEAAPVAASSPVLAAPPTVPAPTSAAPAGEPVRGTLMPTTQFASERSTAGQPLPASPLNLPVESTGTPETLVPPPIADEDLVTKQLKTWLTERNSFTWIPHSGDRAFGIVDLQFGNNLYDFWDWHGVGDDWSELLFRTGLGVHWWSGPDLPVGEINPDVPPRVYDLYFELVWKQRVSEQVRFDVGLTPGWWTDFQVTATQGFRLKGRGQVIWEATDALQIVAGADYINRNRIKLLPIAGLLAKPWQGAEWQLVFPEPKVAQRFGCRPQGELWGYVTGAYGGGSWAFDTAGNYRDWVDYNDWRVMAGMEWRRDGDQVIFLEFGYVFNRQLVFVIATPNQDLSDAIVFRFGSKF